MYILCCLEGERESGNFESVAKGFPNQLSLSKTAYYIIIGNGTNTLSFDIYIYIYICWCRITKEITDNSAKVLKLYVSAYNNAFIRRFCWP